MASGSGLISFLGLKYLYLYLGTSATIDNGAALALKVNGGCAGVSTHSLLANSSIAIDLPFIFSVVLCIFSDINSSNVFPDQLRQ